MIRNRTPEWSLAQQAQMDLLGGGDLYLRQWRELARMQAVGMGWVDRLQQWLAGKIDPATDPVLRKSRGSFLSWQRSGAACGRS
jgi:hypothetical protein